MKKFVTPCAQCRGLSARHRPPNGVDFLPWTLMIVQNEHERAAAAGVERPQPLDGSPQVRDRKMGVDSDPATADPSGSCRSAVSVPLAASCRSAIHSPLQFTGEHADALVLRCLPPTRASARAAWRGPGHMEAADDQGTPAARNCRAYRAHGDTGLIARGRVATGPKPPWCRNCARSFSISMCN